jgi:hypothetical protein
MGSRVLVLLKGDDLGFGSGATSAAFFLSRIPD